MTRTPESQTISADFFAGEGEMADLMRAQDWACTPLGPTSAWPQSLKTTVRILLTSRYAMWMGWGPELTFFCNDAYRPTLGVKGSWALGAPAGQVWTEIWADIGPRIEKVLHTGEATWDEALLLFLERSGYTEETYHTFSYSPLADDLDTISGMLCVVTEETDRILGERRMLLLREVASALASAQTQEEVFAGFARCVEADSRDLPFTLTYLFSGDGSAAHLARTTGISAGHTLAGAVLGQTEAESLWPVQALCADPIPLQMNLLAPQFDVLPFGPWDKPPKQAVVIPISHRGQEGPTGFMVIALNPYRPFDADYEGFVRLLVGQVAASLANAHAYEEEKRRSEALAELDRAKTTFFSNVSHEFRTPLTLMLGPLEEAQGEAPPALDGESLNTVHRNALRLLKLVNTLLDFSRIEAGRVQANYQPTDLAAYTAELASVFRSAIEKAGMSLVLDCPPLSAPVYIDRDMWEKIVLNLLSNAFKFTLEGEITVTLREDSGQAILSVRDTGTGITAEQLPHVFERFHRVEGTRARTHEGTGIGLALVQELIKLHGGAVGVESAYGVGTTFTISLPMGAAHLPRERISAPTTHASTALRSDVFVEEALRWLPEENQPVSSSGLLPTAPLREVQTENGIRPCLLLADDNADMRDYVRRLLQPQYDVRAVSNGAEALQAVREERPALVLSDVMMPVLDGFGLLRELRNDPHTASLPVILLSARAGEEARIEGLAAGADDYLTKPFSARELFARVAAHLELARVRREAEQAMRESEERFRVALSNVPLTVFTCDREQRYTWIANPPSAFSAEQMVGKRDDELFPYDEVAAFMAFKERVLASGQGDRQEIAHSAPTGTAYYDMTAEPLRNREGDIIGLTVAAFDITALKQYEINLAQMNARLQRAMTETHHRVKNNLQLISALIDMQRGSGADSVPMSELVRLGANVRALGVIHDILTQEAKAGSDQETLSVKAVLEKLLSVLKQTTGGRSLRSAFDDARLAGKQVTALALVTNELVSNALKHGKGDVEMTFQVTGDTADLQVCDDGPGFPEGFNAEKAANTGLELVENVVQWDLRGQILYQNRSERGACVRVTFALSPFAGGQEAGV